MQLTNNIQVVVVLCVAALLWACVLVPEKHHETLLRAIHRLLVILVVAVPLVLRFLN